MYQPHTKNMKKNPGVSMGVLLIALLTTTAFADNYPKNPKIDATNYSFKINVSDVSDEILCAVTIDIHYLGEGVEFLRLDLINATPELQGKGMRLSSVSSEGNALPYTHVNDEINIKLSSPSRADQRSKYTIVYKGIPASGLQIANNKYGERTFFSDNWPNKARHWLATIDHPYDKATSEFLVTAPNHYQVVSNGLQIEKSDLSDGMRLTHWKQSVPIAPWLYVLGVARFAFQQVDTFDKKSIETWVYHQDRDAGFDDFAEPTKQVLEFYSDRVGPYAYERLANIQSNSVSGGMEAASAILYSESSVTGTRSLRWRNVIIHEIAHQWFGNSITEYDWDDVWLSEGFATYFTLLFIEHAYGRDEFLKGLEASKKTVNTFYGKNPGYTIIHNNLKDMKDVTSVQTYQKGSWVLHMLRGVIGTDNFWSGIRSYYKKYYNLNATTDDFRREMEEASGKDLSEFFQQWLYKPGTLKYTGHWQYEGKEKQVRITLVQTQKDASIFKMPLELGLYFNGQSQPTMERVEATEKSNVFTIKVGAEPVNIVLDPNNWVLMEAEFQKKK